MQSGRWRRSRRSVSAPGYLQRGGPVCPVCACALLREHRRTVDRWLSLIRPVRRYRCDNYDCQWVGNIAVDAPVRRSPDGRRGGVPVSLVVSMVLVALGVVFALVLSQMDLPFGADASEQARERAVMFSAPV